MYPDLVFSLPHQRWYCVAGTIGHKLMSGKPTKIDLDKDTSIDVRCQIHQLSFSPHADAKGIMDLVKFLSPKHVILVRGEKPKMAALKGKIQSELGIQRYDPANNETVSVPSTHYVKPLASEAFVRSCSNPNFEFGRISSDDRSSMPRLQVTDERVAEGIFVMERGKKPKIVHQEELLVVLGETKHNVKHAHRFPVRIKGDLDCTDRTSTSNATSLATLPWFRLFFAILSDELSEGNVRDFGENLQVDSFCLSICSEDNCPGRISGKAESVFCCCVWLVEDETIARKVVSILENFDFDSVKCQLMPTE